MTRVNAIPDISANGIITVRLRKTVTANDHPHELDDVHQHMIIPGDDPAAVKLILDHDLTTRLRVDAIDDTWERIVGALVSALHTPETVQGFNDDLKERSGREYSPVTLKTARAFTGWTEPPAMPAPVGQLPPPSSPPPRALPPPRQPPAPAPAFFDRLWSFATLKLKRNPT